MDSKGNMRWVVAGEWDNKIEIAPVISSNGSPDNPVIKTGPYTLAWLRKMPPYVLILILLINFVDVLCLIF